MIVSYERGGIIRTRNHIIQVAPVPCGCAYSAEAEIQAGLLTIFVWLYANVFYRYRQARWRKLAGQLMKG